MTRIEQKDVVQLLKTIEVDKYGNFAPLSTWYPGIDEYYNYAIGQAIKVLEQEPDLDKIVAEIADLADADAYGDYQQGFKFGLMRAVQIIDKYKAERSGE